MRAVIQRVTQAQVRVGESIVGEIASGLCILLAVGRYDEPADAEFLIEKIKNLRIFEDQKGKMNLSLLTVDGEVLVVSQFTLYAGWRKGNRPSLTDAAPLAHAEKLYNHFIKRPGYRGFSCHRPVPSQDEGFAGQ